MVSPERASEIISALRRGTVPQRSLDAFAVGLARFEAALDEELERAARGRGEFKAVRGEYGSGKTFFSRWFQERARQHRFATAEVQISESETPLHKHQTIYRRLIERLSTSDTHGGAFRSVVDGWFFALEEDVLAEGKVSEDDAQALLDRTAALMEQRLASINKIAPSFSAALRGYRQATVEGEHAIAEGLLAWLGGQPNVAASVKRYANIKGDVDHDTALNFLQGLLLVLRDAGHAGLLLVLDEVETLQRVRRDIRDKGLNALRQLLDELDQGRFPGLFLVITGTPAFYDGPQGIQRLAPLAQRLHTSFSESIKFENPRAAQIRLAPFDEDRLVEVGCKVRDIFADSSKHADRIRRLADDDYVAVLARAVAGDLGGKVGIAPRLFLRKLINEVLDLIDLNEDFDPRRDYKLTVQESELNEIERNARAASDPDDIELSL